MLSDVNLQPVADKYKVDLARIRSIHELLIKYNSTVERLEVLGSWGGFERLSDLENGYALLIH